MCSQQNAGNNNIVWFSGRLAELEIEIAWRPLAEKEGLVPVAANAIQMDPVVNARDWWCVVLAATDRDACSAHDKRHVFDKLGPRCLPFCCVPVVDFEVVRIAVYMSGQ